MTAGAALNDAKSGKVEVVFSAPFYTGVFLSSRVLQGNYECHRSIVITGMEKELPWGWSYPTDVSVFLDWTVSPPYFIGCSVTDNFDFKEMCEKIETCLSKIKEKNRLMSNLEVVSLDVKFYEFAFGSVSIRLAGTDPEKAKDSEQDYNYMNVLNGCEEEMKKVLNCIAKKAAELYGKVVPCCIKNRDIIDIDNFCQLDGNISYYCRDKNNNETGNTNCSQNGNGEEVDSKDSDDDQNSNENAADSKDGNDEKKGNIDSDGDQNSDKDENGNQLCSLCSPNEVLVLNVHKFIKIDNEEKFSDYHRLSHFFPRPEKEIKRLPFYGRLAVFSSEKGDTTVAIDNDNDRDRVDGFIRVSEAMVVYGALGKYFSNFLYSYYNYSARQYEAIDAPGMYSMKTRFKTRGLLEKFSDIQILYSQSISMMKQTKHTYFTAEQEKFWDAKSCYSKIEKIWENNNEEMDQLKDWYQQVSNVSSHVSIITSVDLALVAIFFSLLSAGLFFVYSIFNSAGMIKNVSFEKISVLGHEIPVGINDISIEYVDRNLLLTIFMIVSFLGALIAFAAIAARMPHIGRSRRKRALPKSERKKLKKEYKQQMKRLKQQGKEPCLNSSECHVCQ